MGVTITICANAIYINRTVYIKFMLDQMQYDRN